MNSNDWRHSMFFREPTEYGVEEPDDLRRATVLLWAYVFLVPCQWGLFGIAAYVDYLGITSSSDVFFWFGFVFLSLAVVIGALGVVSLRHTRDLWEAKATFSEFYD